MHGAPAIQDFVVQMGPRGPPGVAEQTQAIAGLDLLTRLHQEGLEVGITGGKAFGMLHLHHQAVGTIEAGQDHAARRRRHHGCPHRGHKVQALVHAGQVGHGVQAQPKMAGQGKLCLQRQGQRQQLQARLLVAPASLSVLEQMLHIADVLLGRLQALGQGGVLGMPQARPLEWPAPSGRLAACGRRGLGQDLQSDPRQKRLARAFDFLEFVHRAGQLRLQPLELLLVSGLHALLLLQAGDTAHLERQGGRNIHREAKADELKQPAEQQEQAGCRQQRQPQLLTRDRQRHHPGRRSGHPNQLHALPLERSAGFGRAQFQKYIQRSIKTF